MEEKNTEYENVLNWDRDWQRIKDTMTFLETDEQRDKSLKFFFDFNQRM